MTQARVCPRPEFTFANPYGARLPQDRWKPSEAQRRLSPSLNYGEKVSPPVRTHTPSTTRARYWISVSSLNIGRYMEMMITPTISPTPIIMSGSRIEVSVAIELSTSSS